VAPGPVPKSPSDPSPSKEPDADRAAAAGLPAPPLQSGPTPQPPPPQPAPAPQPPRCGGLQDICCSANDGNPPCNDDLICEPPSLKSSEERRCLKPAATAASGAGNTAPSVKSSGKAESQASVPVRPDASVSSPEEKSASAEEGSSFNTPGGATGQVRSKGSSIKTNFSVRTRL
jgi:hypothetical protein